MPLGGSGGYGLSIPATISPDVAAAAVALTRSHPHAPPLDVLDVVFTGSTDATVDPTASWLQLAAPFGLLLVAAFDRGMTSAEWATWSVPPADQALRLALAQVWRERVLAAWLELTFGG